MKKWLLAAAFFLAILSLANGILLRAFINFKSDAAKNNNIIKKEVEEKKTIPPSYISSFLEYFGKGADEDESTFLSVRNNYIENGESFIEVNLREMKLRLYAGGKEFKTLPVLSKGKEGSWWETPTGDYRVLYKSANHYSFIGKVWMPWSIQFYGNFFIHGWPYYDDGTPVSKNYSGGCVRLSTESAKEVFEFAKKGMPILILETPDFIATSSEIVPKKFSDNLAIPSISAESALVADLDSGQILLDKNSNKQLPIASLTKLMTAVVASEAINLERTVKITENMLNATVQSTPLNVGENYAVFDLLYPLLQQSSNGAAEAIASVLGRSFFVSQMNFKAKSLGMRNTNFADASGISDDNISTLSDLAKMAKYILDKRIFIFNITIGKRISVFGPGKFLNIKNFNDFAENAELIGTKNGKTGAALETIITVWKFKDKDENERRIFIGVLRSENRKADTEIILNWLKENFELN